MPDVNYFFLENLLFKLFFSYLPNTINGLSLLFVKYSLFFLGILLISLVLPTHIILCFIPKIENFDFRISTIILRLLSKPTIYFIVCFNLGTTPLVIPIHLIINYLLIKI